MACSRRLTVTGYKSAVIFFVVRRSTLEKAALDLEIFITFQAATDMVEI